jgi:hypothetical protein
MSNYANFSTNQQNDNLRSDKFSCSNIPWAFGRELEINPTVKTTPNAPILNDRDMFNKFSNTNESIDTSTFNPTDAWGMPIQGGCTTNNKKSLLTTPYIMEVNDKNGWTPISTTWNQNDMYAELNKNNNLTNSQNISNPSNTTNEMNHSNSINSSNSSNPSNPSNSDDMLELAYNNKLAGTNEDNGICKIEADCLGFEYELTKQKQKDIIIDVSSPFALGYIWKSLILLSKNPSADKLVKLLGIKSKDSIVSDMKRHAEVFEDSGSLEYMIPINSTNQTSNTNYIQKIEEIYKISVIPDNETTENILTINMKWDFLLEIPFYYQPQIINDYLINYTKAKTKFLELTDVPIFLMIDKIKDLVCIEIPCSSNMVLGFIYSPTKELVNTIPYDLITQPKKPEILAKKLIIPKLNRNKKTVYSKNFKDVLNQIHLGEIVYGTLYKVDINMDIGLSIGVNKEIPLTNKYEITKSFDEITINHKCFYYVKNNFIQNKILATGTISY